MKTVYIIFLLSKGAKTMKKLLAVLLTLTMLVTLSAFGASADNVNGSTTGVLPDNFTTENVGGENLNVKVTQITHKYAVDIVFSLGVLEIGGNITWNVNTMRYDVNGTPLADTTRKVTVSNRSDLPVYAFAKVTDTAADDGISVTADKDSATNRLTIAKATAGTGANGSPTPGELTINLKSGDWKNVAEHYAAKRLESDNQATDTFTIATVTVTISKN